MDIRHFKKGAKQEKEAKQDAKKIDPQKIRPEDIPDGVDAESVRRQFGELSGKSESELLTRLFGEIEAGKQDGSFSAEKLSDFMSKVSPMLTEEQRARMESIVKTIK